MQLRNLFLKLYFLYNIQVDISNLLRFYNLLLTKVFFFPFQLLFIYTKHVYLILDRAVLIYIIDHLSNIHFFINEKAFFCQKHNRIHGLKYRLSFFISQEK